MRPRFDNQILLGVKIGEVRRNLYIARLQAIDLPEHGDRLQCKILIAIMLSDTTKTSNRRRLDRKSVV